MRWTADITNDPTRDFGLCVDIAEGSEHRGTVFRASDGELKIRIYPSGVQSFEMPARWLSGVLEMAERDL